MAGKRSTSEYSPTVPDTYLAMLREIRDEKNVTNKDLEEHPEMDGATAWRVLKEDTSEATLVRVERVRRVLEDLTEKDIPPPVVTVNDEEHYEWLRAGEILKREKPTLYRELFEAATKVAGPILLAEKREREAMIRLRKLKRK